MVPSESLLYREVLRCRVLYTRGAQDRRTQLASCSGWPSRAYIAEISRPAPNPLKTVTFHRHFEYAYPQRQAHRSPCTQKRLSKRVPTGENGVPTGEDHLFSHADPAADATRWPPSTMGLGDGNHGLRTAGLNHGKNIREHLGIAKVLVGCLGFAMSPPVYNASFVVKSCGCPNLVRIFCDKT
jgi:hypothetical protein